MSKNQKSPVPSPGQLMNDNSMYYFCDQFSNATTKPVIEFIIEKNLLPNSDRPEEITLIINSPGGDVNSAFALVDVMKGSSIPVKTVGIGLIASAGLVAFMSGARGSRVITPNTSILSHQYSWGSHGKEHELFATIKEFEMTTDRMMKLYKNCTGLTDKVIREILLPPHDVWLSAQDAIKYNIADKIKKLY
jgi:ATP-dependent Clp protease protease subunit